MKGLLKLAKSDLKYALFAYTQIQQTSDEADLNICAYHTQQCTEKILKYLLDTHTIPYTRTHDISILVDLCLDHHLAIPDIIENLAPTITTWAVHSRYNSEFKTSIRSLNKVLKCCEEWLSALEISTVNHPNFNDSM
ncbi:MAG: HEPN domain-containing protein [Cellulosilyticaceae bacterium]